MKVRIGVGSVPVGVQGPGVGPDLADLVDELEAHRIDSVWLSDLVSARHTTDPLIGLAYAAGRTERLKLGTGVLVLPGRNPALVAAQLAGLAALAPGRVLPAFGVRPALAPDRTMFPVPDGRRAEAFEEALVVVRALLTRPSVTHHGEFFQFDEASVAPLPAKPLDLWLGGRLPVGMRRIGRLADGWLGSFVTPEEAAVCRSQIEAAAAEAGREVEEDHYGTNVLVAPDGYQESDLDAALATALRRRKDVDPDRLICRGWAAARDELRRFVDAGLTKFVVRPATPVTSRRDFLDQLTTELLPLQT
ncbi:TIGR03854 family LLM class F420-dependent oxidoreductase [Pseudonocardia acaciae]|uniref:TIGR03854 family LLM class F420-dependent oxidoreductase n=1 Tax=Pseudonocardia acaciae TaxID=551276 RepID=UPI00048B4F79|nr:TIGR03854 family LLM class F420-dependent oxidoreductase [Pseudonocardia acaciae]